MNASLGALRKPVRTVLRWQLIATAALTLAGGVLAGVDGALSAALGGAVSICAGGVSAVVASKGRARSAGGVLISALVAGFEETTRLPVLHVELDARITKRASELEALYRSHDWTWRR